jgi:tRNA pseudouridine synthase 10
MDAIGIMKLSSKTKRIAAVILGSGYVCNRCLGRQFAKLAEGRNNMERGRIMRDSLTAEYGAGKIKADPSNFHGYGRGASCPEKRPKCVVCENVLENLAELAGKPIEELKKTDSGRFAIGIKMSDSLIMNEEALWEKTGVKYCEPIKSEISRELAGLIRKGTRKKPD